MGRPRKNPVVVQPPPAAPQMELSAEEIQAILALRANRSVGATAPAEPAPNTAVAELAQVLTIALNATKPIEKKTVANRKKMNPWMPKDGSPKILSFKRPMYHHGLELSPKTTHNADCLLLDKIRPGKYLNGHITVSKRKDGGLDIDYPIRTAAQRLKLSSQFGINSFNAMLQMIVNEGEARRNRVRDMSTDDEDE